MKPNQSRASVNVDWFHSTRRGIALFSANSRVRGLRTDLPDFSEAYRYPLIAFAQSEGRRGS